MNQKKSYADYLDQLANHERIRIIRASGKFNYSKINNLGVDHAKENFYYSLIMILNLLTRIG